MNISKHNVWQFARECAEIEYEQWEKRYIDQSISSRKHPIYDYIISIKRNLFSDENYSLFSEDEDIKPTLQDVEGIFGQKRKGIVLHDYYGLLLRERIVLPLHSRTENHGFIVRKPISDDSPKLEIWPNLPLIPGFIDRWGKSHWQQLIQIPSREKEYSNCYASIWPNQVLALFTNDLVHMSGAQVCSDRAAKLPRIFGYDADSEKYRLPRFTNFEKFARNIRKIARKIKSKTIGLSVPELDHPDGLLFINPYMAQGNKRASLIDVVDCGSGKRVNIIVPPDSIAFDEEFALHPYQGRGMIFSQSIDEIFKPTEFYERRYKNQI